MKETIDMTHNRLNISIIGFLPATTILALLFMNIAYSMGQSGIEQKDGLDSLKSTSVTPSELEQLETDVKASHARYSAQAKKASLLEAKLKSSRSMLSHKRTEYNNLMRAHNMGGHRINYQEAQRLKPQIKALERTVEQQNDAVEKLQKMNSEHQGAFETTMHKLLNVKTLALSDAATNGGEPDAGMGSTFRKITLDETHYTPRERYKELPGVTVVSRSGERRKGTTRIDDVIESSCVFTELLIIANPLKESIEDVWMIESSAPIEANATTLPEGMELKKVGVLKPRQVSVRRNTWISERRIVRYHYALGRINDGYIWIRLSSGSRRLAGDEQAANALIQMARLYEANGKEDIAEQKYKKVLSDYPESNAAATAREKLGVAKKERSTDHKKPKNNDEGDGIDGIVSNTFAERVLAVAKKHREESTFEGDGDGHRRSTEKSDR